MKALCLQGSHIRIYMMIQFILTTLFMVSFGGLLYLLARSLPRIDDEATLERGTVLDRWVASEMPEKLDVVLNAFLAKFFRRLRVFLLRVDNVVSDTLKKIPTETNGNSKKKIDFKEIHGKNNVAKNENSG